MEFEAGLLSDHSQRSGKIIRVQKTKGYLLTRGKRMATQKPVILSAAYGLLLFLQTTPMRH